MAHTTTTPMACPDVAVQATLSVAEAARIFGVSLGTMYRWIDLGDLPVVRVGKRIVIPTAVVRRMLHLDDPTPTAS